MVHICNPIILEAEAGACLGVQGQYGLHNEFQTSLGYKAGLSQIKPKIQCLSASTIKEPSLAKVRKRQDWSSWTGKDLNNGFLQAPRWSWVKQPVVSGDSGGGWGLVAARADLSVCVSRGGGGGGR